MKTVRPSVIIPLVDAAVIGILAALIVRPRVAGIVYAVATIVVIAASRGYRPRIHYRLSMQLPALVAQVTVSMLLLSFWTVSDRVTLADQVAVTVSAVILARLAVYARLGALRRRLPASRSDHALIIGAGDRGRMVAEALLRNPGCAITPIGFVAPSPAATDSPLPIVSDLAHVDEAIGRFGVRHLFVAEAPGGEPGTAGAGISARLWHWQARRIDVWVVPPLLECGSDRGRASEDLWAIPFQHLRRPGQHTGARVVKRSFDIMVGSATMILTAPVMGLVAMAVRLTSPGPIFFRQTRVGQDAREFQLLKFRTMRVNDDSDTMWSVTNERRFTPIGQFLRRACIDELPQFLNVIRGDMSLVGPRPERPYFHQLFTATVPHYRDRLRAPVGMTGWSQIHGLRGDTSLVERTRFDNYYIEHWSLWLDVVIMARTVVSLFQWVFLTEAARPEAGDLRADAAGRTLPVAVPANAGGNQT